MIFSSLLRVHIMNMELLKVVDDNPSMAVRIATNIHCIDVPANMTQQRTTELSVTSFQVHILSLLLN